MRQLGNANATPPPWGVVAVGESPQGEAKPRTRSRLPAIGSRSAGVWLASPWLPLAIAWVVAAAAISRTAHADELDAAATAPAVVDAQADQRQEDSAFLESTGEETWDLGPGECVLDVHCGPCAHCVTGKCEDVVPECGDVTSCALGSVCTVPQYKPICAAKCLPAPASCNTDADCPACNACDTGVCSWTGAPKACNGGKGCPDNSYCQLGALGPCTAMCVLKPGHCNFMSDCPTCQVCSSGKCGYHPEYTCKGNSDCPKGHMCQVSKKVIFCVSKCVPYSDAMDATADVPPDSPPDTAPSVETGPIADAPPKEGPGTDLGAAVDATAQADNAAATPAPPAVDSGCAAPTAATSPSALAWLLSGLTVVVYRRRHPKAGVTGVRT